jgi:hypothetical protein
MNNYKCLFFACITGLIKERAILYMVRAVFFNIIGGWKCQIAVLNFLKFSGSLCLMKNVTFGLLELKEFSIGNQTEFRRSSLEKTEMRENRSKFSKPIILKAGNEMNKSLK